jgi:hypothetical protein
MRIAATEFRAALFNDPKTHAKCVVTDENPLEAVKAFVVGEQERCVYVPLRAKFEAEVLAPRRAAQVEARQSKKLVRDAVRIERQIIIDAAKAKCRAIMVAARARVSP